MASRVFVTTSLAAGAAAVAALVVAACGGGGSSSPGPTPVPSPTPTLTHYACTAPANVRSSTFSHFGDILTRRPFRESRTKNDVVPGVVAVRFALPDSTNLQAAAQRIGGNIVSTFNRQGAATISLPAGRDPMSAAAMLRTMPGVVAAGPVIERHLEGQVIPNNPLFGTLPYTVPNPNANNPPIQWDMYITNMPATWGLGTGFGSSAVKIAMIDTGYDTTNPDLAGRIAGCIVFDKGNGQEDVNASIQDFDGHGTDTSGIADADTNQGTYAAGTTGNVELLEARVFPTPDAQNTAPGASTEDVASAINWAVANGANVISMSIGSGSPDNTYEEPAVAAAIAAGVTVVAAAGNETQDTLDYPAADPKVIAVGASALNDSGTPRDYQTATEYVASYSNWVPSPASNVYYVVAPGGDPDLAQQGCGANSCIDFLQWITNLYSTTAYQNTGSFDILIAGTSMSTPHVAGLAALMLSKDPSLTPVQIDTLIEDNTDNIGDAKQGHGRVDADKTLTNTP
jgi:subtilisin family serine protease